MQSVRRRAVFLRGGCVIQIYCVPSLMTAFYHLEIIAIARAGLGFHRTAPSTGSVFFYRRKPLDPADRAFAFDYHGSGKLDHLALYGPGTGTIWILRNSGGSFAPVYAQGSCS